MNPIETEIAPVELMVDVGKFQITHNVGAFRGYIRNVLSTVNTTLETDEDFDKAAEDVKMLKGVEDKIKTCKEAFLSKCVDINTIMSEFAGAAQDVAGIRLNLEKQVKTRSDEKRAELHREYLGKIELPYSTASRNFSDSLTGAIKGKRSLDSIRKALEVCVATHNAQIRKAKELIDAHISEHGNSMITDYDDLAAKRVDIVENELARRVERKRADEARRAAEEEARKARQEAEEARRKAAEEAARASREAEEKREPAIEAKPIENPPESQPSDAGDNLTDPCLEAREFEAFLETIRAAFAPIKEARERLTYPLNQAKALSFRDKLNEAWKEMIS